jgi:hypothetical protein
MGDRPADRLRLRLDRDRTLRPDDLRDEQLGRRRESRHPHRVVRLGRDQAGHERPVALGVDQGRARDEAPGCGDAALQLWMRTVDPRVDHRHAHGGKRGRIGPRVERAVLHCVPLLHEERVVGDVGGTAEAEALHVPHSGNAADGRDAGRGDGKRADRREIFHPGGPPFPQLLYDRRAIG